jgi:alanine racemase
VSVSATPIEQRLVAAGLPPLPRRAWLEIDVAALTSNVATLRALLAPGVRLAAVVKADAYGHGLLPAARTFAAAGVDALCVATLDEALAVAGAGVGVPVLLLYEPPPDGFAVAAAAGVEVTVASEATVERVAALGRQAVRLRVHLEVDTGLRRAGVLPERIAAAAARLTRAPGVALVGLWTHLASAHDAAASREQAERFARACASLADGLADGVARPVVRHISATGGLLAASAPQLDMVRIGLALYGLLPEALPIAPAAHDAAQALRPAMSLHARPLRLAQVAPGEGVGYGSRWRAARPSRVATLPLGYGDGWSYGSAGRTFALVRGRRVPLVGSVAMDAVAADVTDVPGVTAGDEFVLLGAQGGAQIGALELAQQRTTIPWEVVTSMASRLPRVYHAAGKVLSVRTLAGEVRRADARTV